jgi:hypothetical protein
VRRAIIATDRCQRSFECSPDKRHASSLRASSQRNGRIDLR